jgi:hypothetical protein
MRVTEKRTTFDSASASEAAKRRWAKRDAKDDVRGAASPAEFSLGDVRRVGILAIQEFERRLDSGRPLSDTALSRAVSQLVQLLEAEEERRRLEMDAPRQQLQDGLDRDWHMVDTLERDCLPDEALLEYGEKVRPMYVEMLSRLDARLEQLRGRAAGAARDGNAADATAGGVARS